jgi:signal peptidase I
VRGVATTTEPREDLTDPPVPPEPPSRWRRVRQHAVVDLLVTLLVAVGVAYGVQRWVVKPYRIPTGSMEHTLDIGDRLIAARFWYDFTSPSRGDVVVFHPNGRGGDVYRTNHVADVTFVKRIIGMPGDWVRGRDDHVDICRTATTGCRVLHESYVSSAQADFGPVHVPKGRYFMMGDNRAVSDDSRVWGTISGSQIIGRAVSIYWPLDHLHLF